MVSLIMYFIMQVLADILSESQPHTDDRSDNDRDDSDDEEEPLHFSLNDAIYAEDIDSTIDDEAL